MAKNKRNNLILTLTIFVVVIGASMAFFLIKSHESPKDFTGHQIIFAADSGQSESIGIDKLMNLRKYTVYNLTGDSLTNMQTLEAAGRKLNVIKNAQDTVNGIHIILPDNTPYQFFIKAIDICSEIAPCVFSPNKNDIYAWYMFIPKEKSEEITTDK